MPIPQVTDRIKEAPAVALRAVFAGVGQLLMVVDKIRAQMQEQATSPAPGGEKGSSAGQPARPPDKSGNAAQHHERPTRAAPRPAATAASAASAPSAPAAPKRAAARTAAPKTATSKPAASKPASPKSASPKSATAHK